MYKKTLSYALTIIFCTCINAQDNHKPYFSKTAATMHELFEQMQDDMDQMMGDMWSVSKQSTISTAMPTVVQTDEHVLINVKVPSIDTDAFPDMIKKMTSSNGDYIIVSIPEKTMTTEMTITPYEISFSSKQEIKEEKMDEENNKPSVVYYSSGSSMMRQGLPAKVMFEDVKAEYEGDTLTITLAKAEPKKIGQRIPVLKK